MGDSTQHPYVYTEILRQVITTWLDKAAALNLGDETLTQVAQSSINQCAGQLLGLIEAVEGQ